ncbi:ABC transporter substrate binding protein [Sedimentisphaera salicampi]|uniref:histidine kinase n=1 Tax=Sedimentisphaera salicampi TaxID=1941349 RepID=A0A1W6LLD0_9BACT|nr:ABC transporter substrate binding protein [Sedimentisphaera salicampi]ARN56552.1 Sensory/regulatory protein RpfC [Sedimentisphaera salicampi]
MKYCSQDNSCFPLDCRRLVVLIAILCFSTSAISNSENAGSYQIPKSNVLMLNSYHKGNLWEDRITEAVEEQFREYPQIKLHIEYLDAKRHPLPETEQAFIALFREKFKSRKLDLVIAADNNALEFTVRRRKELFPQTPIVFCGINDYSEDMLDNPDWYTGVDDINDPLASIELIKKLNPNLKSVAVVGDGTKTGIGAVNNVHKALNGKVRDVEIRYLTGLNMDEFTKELSALSPETDAALLTLVNRTPDGEYYTYKESAGILAEASPAPIFCMNKVNIGSGVVGGKVGSGSGEGKLAGELALKVLSGKAPSEIPVVRESEEVILDYAALERFGFEDSPALENYQIINKPYNWAERHKGKIILVMAVIAAQALVILVLILKLLKREKAKVEEAKYNQLKTVMDGLPDMVALIKPDMTIEYCNKAAAKIVGRNAEETIGKKCFSLLCRDEPCGQCAFHEAVEKKKPVSAVRYIAPLNVWVSEASVPILNSSGEIEKILQRLEDITELKEYEKQIELNNERYRQLSMHSKTFAWEIDPEGLYTFVSDISKEVIGYAPEELVGKKHFYDLWPEDEKARLMSSAFEIIRKKESFRDFQDKTITKNGQEIWLSTSGFPVLSDSGELLGYRGTDKDITESMNSRLALKNQAYLLSAAESSTVLLLEENELDKAAPKALELIGKAANQDRTYIFECHKDSETGKMLTSQRYEWTKAEVGSQLSNPDLQNIPLEENIPRWYENLTQGRIIAGNVKDFPVNEQELLRPQKIISLIVVPIKIKNEFWGFVGFDNCRFEQEWSEAERSILSSLAGSFGAAVNRTKIEQKLKDSLRHSEKLNEVLGQQVESANRLTIAAEAANVAKARFLASMSHELRTPLNAIIGMGQVIDDDQLDEKKREGVQLIVKSGRKLTNLINDILEYSKAEAKGLEVQENEFSLREFMGGIYEMAAERAWQKQISADMSIDEQLPDKMLGDTQLLRQVLANLTGNAVKFTHEGGVKIKAALEEINGHQARVKFTVEDTGIGIPKGRLEELFDKFTQADASDSRKYEGTGLGLALSKELVELMGGQIEAESEEGKGSVFWFTVKLKIPQE